MEDIVRQDEYLRSNIQNMVQCAQNQYYARFSAFLDERQQALAEGVLQKLRYGGFAFFGGADGCERAMLGVFPLSEETDLSRFPIVPLALRSAKEPFSHRDCLGSLMGLGLKRASIGDIWVARTTAIVFAAEDVADFICSQLSRVGKIPVTVDTPRPEELVHEVRYEEKRGTVASMRLDCLVSLATGKSRTQAGELIAAELVSVNRLPVKHAAKLLAPDDQLVIRGYGKFRIGGDVRQTKKGRLSVVIKKLV